MGDERLRLNTSELIELGAALRMVAEEFHHANSTSDDLADAAGDPELADALRTVAHEWDDKRRKMLDDIAIVADAARAIGETFEALDRDFAAALLGER